MENKHGWQPQFESNKPQAKFHFWSRNAICCCNLRVWQFLNSWGCRDVADSWELKLTWHLRTTDGEKSAFVAGNNELIPYTSRNALYQPEVPLDTPLYIQWIRSIPSIYSVQWRMNLIKQADFSHLYIVDNTVWTLDVCEGQVTTKMESRLGSLGH